MTRNQIRANEITARLFGAPAARDWTDLDLPYEIFHKPLPWQVAGLQQTSSGYGARLASSYCVRLQDGRVRRVYVTCLSNAGTSWIVLNKLRRIVRF